MDCDISIVTRATCHIVKLGSDVMLTLVAINAASELINRFYPAGASAAIFVCHFEASLWQQSAFASAMV